MHSTMKFKNPLLNAALLILTITIGFLSGQALAAQVTATVDRNPVGIGESFKIFFTASDSPDGDPDFSPLEKYFDIINQSQSSSLSMVNGNYTKSVRWTVEVAAKKAGNLEIPAIQFGSDSSDSLAIVVNQGSAGATDGSTHTNEDIFLDVKAEPNNPYVQSQVLYTVRLFRRVDIAQAELSEPELADAVIEKLGEDSNFNTVDNGVSYIVTERKYAIFPQKSGVMNIKPLSLTAQVIVASQPDFGDFFGSRMTKTKRVLSKEVVLDVKPAPSDFKGKDWLAAEKLELSEEWSGDNQQMKIGEPLTRTLTLRGTGTTVGQLPELNPVKTDANLKAYPDQPVLNEEKQANGVTATRQEKIALIPSTPGKHVLPSIEIPWFNTRTHKMEIARIPERAINVAGDASESKASSPAPKPLNTMSAPNAIPDKPAPAPSVLNPSPQNNSWMWVSLFLALGWLLTLVYFLVKRTKPQTLGQNTVPANEIGLKESVNKLKSACSSGDAQAAKDALLAWGKLKFNAANLGAVANVCDARLRDEILHLNKALYGGKDSQWTGKKLFQAFTENNAREKIVSKEEVGLEPLHRI